MKIVSTFVRSRCRDEAFGHVRGQAAVARYLLYELRTGSEQAGASEHASVPYIGVEIIRAFEQRRNTICSKILKV
jgi:hypothetical protein